MGISVGFLISGISFGTLQQCVFDFALQATRSSSGGADIGNPRIGLYQPWGGNIDEGWTRWVVEMYGFDPVTIRPGDIKAGNLRERFDIIVLADFGARTLVEGRSPGSVPGRYAGGIGREGVRIMDAFVRQGGTLVCINNSSMFAIDEFHLPVRNVVEDVGRQPWRACCREQGDAGTEGQDGSWRPIGSLTHRKDVAPPGHGRTEQQQSGFGTVEELAPGAAPEPDMPDGCNGEAQVSGHRPGQRLTWRHCATSR